VQIDGGMAESQYQLGLVRARRQDWREAAEAFQRAAEVNPANAYAHYYGGLMHYRAGRPDRMAIHFEQFLRLAPDAPERPEVLQIMKTVRLEGLADTDGHPSGPFRSGRERPGEIGAQDAERRP
jgi:tetratricopeptide (TPR) repeat protein